jgi:glutaconate CoA-transferase, subunit A
MAQPTKVTTLEVAIGTIPDGAMVALGGNTLHRAPCAAVHELIRQRKRGLELVKTAGSYDVDILVGAGAVRAVSAGYVGYENVFGLAPLYRREVEQGRVEAKEHTCYSVVAGLRAAAQGVPFMPMAGLTGSDLPEARSFRTVSDPYSGAEVYVIPALRPDVALIHVQEADELGNARIWGSVFEDVLMVQAAASVIITAERIVDGSAFEAQPELTDISSLFVTAVVEAPEGAKPLSCYGLYEFDRAYLAAYLSASRDVDSLDRFLAAQLSLPAIVG